jgi:hypothetical protein
VILAKETFGAVVVEKNSFVVLEIEKEVPYSNPFYGPLIRHHIK